MAVLSTALAFARTYLNDPNGISWTDANLIPLAQLAHTELVQELSKHNVGVLKAQTGRITVPTGATTLGTSQPVNLLNPISIVEGDVGTDIENFEDMIKVSFIPEEDQDSWLTYWAWIGQIITFSGATSDRQVILRYEGSIVTPQLQTDQIGVIFGENFIGPRIASLASISVGKDYKTIQAIAETNLYKLIQSAVTDDQRPTRRRAYRSSKGFYSPGRI